MNPSDRVGKARRRKVDLSLLDRRKVLQCLETIRGGAMSAMDAEDLARKMAGLGKIVPVTLSQALETERDPAVVGLAARTLECMVELDPAHAPRCIAALKKLVLTGGLCDEAKMRLLVALGRLGVDVADPRYASSFKDFTSVAQAFRESVLTEIASDEFLLSQLLEEIAQLPSEARVSVVQDYAQSHEPTGLHVHRILGRSDDPKVGRAVVESLLREPTGDSAGVLRSLSSESLSVETRERAGRALKALRFAGVSPPRVREKKPGRVYHALVSALDGVGSRMIWVARETERPDQLFAIHLMVNEAFGLKDCFGSGQMPRDDYDERVRSLADPGEIAYEVTDYDYCVTLVRDALATNVRAAAPVAPQFILLMDIFGDRTLEPQPYTPRFPQYDLAALAQDRQLIQLSLTSLQMPALATWFVITETVCALARRANRLMEPCSGRSAFLGDVCDRIGRMHKEIVLDSLVPLAPVLRRRLELMADYLLRAPIPRTDHAMALLAAAQHLPAADSDGGGAPAWPKAAIPAAQNPFLLAMARRSLESAQAALNLGHGMDAVPENKP
ncbi:MAG: hypothetical protein LC772_09860 [Chloroflexi bacterium]|nr:hypothetical protein [Chloroflexota bacterium]